jgi:hypothetical protein
MSEIVLTDEQVQRIASATSPIPVRDASGRVIGVCSLFRTELKNGSAATSPSAAANSLQFTDEEIEQALRNRDSAGPWYTTAEVLTYLQSLDQSR